MRFKRENTKSSDRNLVPQLNMPVSDKTLKSDKKFTKHRSQLWVAENYSQMFPDTKMI